MGIEQKSIVKALTEEQVAKVTGLTKGQLKAWDRRGFFVPQYAFDDRRSPYSRIYSFHDVVGLKTVETLRRKYKIGFQTLRRVASELKQRGYEHWADTKLYVVKKSVYFKDPGSSRVESLDDGQFAMLEVIDVINDVSEKVVALKKRPTSARGAVERNRYVERNSWVIAGTRIPTATIRRYSDAGFSTEQIIEEYPSLTEDDVKAALRHEAEQKNSA